MNISETLGALSAEAVNAGETVALPTLSGIVDGILATAVQARPLVSAAGALANEAVRIVKGESEIEAQRGDWRFTDPAWDENPIYHRLMQIYLAGCDAVDSVLDEVTESSAPDRAERARFVMNIVTSAVAPTNQLLGNPAALKKTFDTGGANLVRGAKNFADDVLHNGGMPSMAKRGALLAGRDMAITPGHVVARDEYGELLQYTPTTETVFDRPVLVIPPPVGRYYFLDLRPGRSFVEYAVSRGLQTFLLSWRKPTAENAEWNIDTYARRAVDAIREVRDRTGVQDVNIIGFCAGGILQTAVLNHLAATGEQLVHSASYGVTLLDFGLPAPIGAFSSARLIDFTRGRARTAGITSARAMGSAFTWTRPNDLMWNYFVNNYLLGQEPPVFDILAWNSHGSNLPAALHNEFMDIFRDNPLVQPGASTHLGTPIDLSTIEVPNYVVGAVSDHLTPWKATFQTTQLLSGDSTYVLSNAGHIAALVNPPDNPKASYFTGPLSVPQTPEEWQEGATRQQGSWWEHWCTWVSERSGERRPVSADRAEQFADLPAAPGEYVLEPN
jgi:polyhydroxyalkanoate synthase